MLRTVNAKLTFDWIVRALALAFAGAAWYLSIVFSVDGFNIDVPNMRYVGWILGFGVTVLELTWNRGYTRAHIGLFIAGLAAYVYGVYTNVMGVSVTSQIGHVTVGHIILGTFLEIIPEPLLLFSLLGRKIVEKPWWDGMMVKPVQPQRPRPKVEQTAIPKCGLCGGAHKTASCPRIQRSVRR